MDALGPSTGKPPELPTRYIVVPSSGFESRSGTKTESGIWIVTATWLNCRVGWIRVVGLADPRATVGRGTGVTMGPGATFALLRLKKTAAPARTITAIRAPTAFALDRGRVASGCALWSGLVPS